MVTTYFADIDLRPVMNVIATAALLIITLLLVPVISYLSGTALGPAELSALRSLLWILLGAWAGCFLLGEITGNVSQVDRLWSLLPVVYAWVVAAYGDFSTRLLLMALLLLLAYPARSRAG